MKKEWSTVEILSHSRHDWLNKIQLIKGNLSLNKIERVKEIIDEIVVESRQESMLSNLNIPQFAALLLTYNWESHSIHLEFEIQEYKNNQSNLQINDELLANWTSSFLEELQTSTKEFHENDLSITIEIQETGIGFFFDFRGIITDMEQIQMFFTKDSSVDKKVHELSDQELALEVLFPYE